MSQCVSALSSVRTGSATITRNLIDGYQKNGMTIDNVGSSATVVGNILRGAGQTPVIAQNGIQISRGAFAVVRDNEVSDNIYTGPFMAVASSSGILLYGDPVDPSPAPGTTVADNLVFRTDHNIPAFGTQLVRIVENTVLGATRFDGIYMDATRTTTGSRATSSATIWNTTAMTTRSARVPAVPRTSGSTMTV